MAIAPDIVGSSPDGAVLSPGVVVHYSDDDSSWIVSPTPAGGFLNREALPLAIDDEARNASPWVSRCWSREHVRGRWPALLSEFEERPGVRTPVAEFLLVLRLRGPGSGQARRCWRVSECRGVSGVWRGW